MSKFRKSFNDIYSLMWDILDKPKLSLGDRLRLKQLLNQLWKEHYFGKWYIKPLKFRKQDIKQEQ